MLNERAVGARMLWRQRQRAPPQHDAAQDNPEGSTPRDHGGERLTGGDEPAVGGALQRPGILVPVI